VKKTWGIAVGVAALCAPATALGAFAASSMTGNPQGIKLAHEVMRAFRHIPGYRQSEQHFFQLKYDTKSHTFTYWYGKAPRSGFVWATENSTLRIHDNRVVWWLDALTPVSGHHSPVMIIVNKSGRFTAFGTPSRHSCFTRVPSTSTLPYRYGGLGYSIGGRMGAPQRAADTVLLPYVYRWEVHLTSNETDTISHATKLVLSGKVDITHHDGSPVLSFDFTNSYPRNTPRPPGVKLCGR
jgi:hypothetical protein